MATNRYRCESCLYEGMPAEFEEDCPKCGSEDVFPYRFYECICGAKGDQKVFYENSSADLDPAEDKSVTAHCPDCGSSQVKQVA